MTKKSQKVKKIFKSRKNRKSITDKHFLLQHSEHENIDFSQVRNIDEDEDNFIRNEAKRNGVNPILEITTSILNILNIKEETKF